MAQEESSYTDCDHHLVPTLVEVFTIDQRGKSESQPL